MVKGGLPFAPDVVATRREGRRAWIRSLPLALFVGEPDDLVIVPNGLGRRRSGW